MESPDTSPTVSSVESDFATFGAVHLDITDLDRALGFWRDLIGLQVLSGPEPVAVVGVPGRPLVVLHPGAIGPLPRNFCGLYHLAIHVPTLEDFARIQARAESVGYPGSAICRARAANWSGSADAVIGTSWEVETARGRPS